MSVRAIVLVGFFAISAMAAATEDPNSESIIRKLAPSAQEWAKTHSDLLTKQPAGDQIEMKPLLLTPVVICNRELAKAVKLGLRTARRKSDPEGVYKPTGLESKISLKENKLVFDQLNSVLTDPNLKAKFYSGAAGDDGIVELAPDVARATLSQILDPKTQLPVIERSGIRGCSLVSDGIATFFQDLKLKVYEQNLKD